MHGAIANILCSQMITKYRQHVTASTVHLAALTGFAEETIIGFESGDLNPTPADLACITSAVYTGKSMQQLQAVADVAAAASKADPTNMALMEATFRTYLQVLAAQGTMQVRMDGELVDFADQIDWISTETLRRVVAYEAFYQQSCLDTPEYASMSRYQWLAEFLFYVPPDGPRNHLMARTPLPPTDPRCRRYVGACISLGINPVRPQELHAA